MTIIFNQGKFFIEFLDIALTTTAAAEVQNTSFVSHTPCNLLGFSASFSNSAAFTEFATGLSLNDSSGSSINIGDFSTSVRASWFQPDATSRLMTVIVMIFGRRRSD